MNDKQIYDNQKREKIKMSGNNSIVKFLFSNGKNYAGYYYFQNQKHAIDFDFELIQSFLENFSITRGDTLSELSFSYMGEDDEVDDYLFENYEDGIKHKSARTLPESGDSNGTPWRISRELPFTNQQIEKIIKDINSIIKGIKK